MLDRLYSPQEVLNTFPDGPRWPQAVTEALDCQGQAVRLLPQTWARNRLHIGTGQTVTGSSHMALRIFKYPKSPYYQIRGTIGGHVIHESTGTDDRKKAEKLRLKRENELFDRIKLGEVQPLTFAAAADHYSNKGGEIKYVTKLVAYFKDEKLKNIGQAEIEKAACTLMHVVVDMFTTRFGFPCKSSAHPCQGISLPVCKGFSSISDAFGHRSFTIGYHTLWATLSGERV